MFSVTKSGGDSHLMHVKNWIT